MIVALFKRLWDSPTFTSWGNQGAKALRLVVLLPLALKCLDDVQLASWLLFGSLSFLGMLLSRQTAVAFSRMFALAAGGASNLSPLLPGEERKSAGSMNWSLIERLYGTLQFLNLGLAALTAMIALGMGGFSLPKLLEGYALSGEVWFAFGVLLIGSLIVECFRKYAIILRGLNQVALTNRWEALFSLLTALSSALVLMVGGRIVALICVQVVFDLLRVLRMWLLLNFVVEPRFRAMRSWSWDGEIVGWVWQPVWRGLIQALANRGGLRFGIVILARHLDAAALSSVLIALRLLETSSDIATAPVTSHVPRFARLLGAGSVDRLRAGVLSALKLAQWLEVVAVVAIGFGAIFTIQVFSLDVRFPALDFFFCFALLYVLVASIRRMLMIPLIGNRVVAFKQMLVAFVVSLAGAFYLIPILGAWGFILSSFLPVVLIVNFIPLKESAALLQLDSIKLFVSVPLIPICLLVLVLLLVCFFPVDTYLMNVTETLRSLIRGSFAL